VTILLVTEITRTSKTRLNVLSNVLTFSKKNISDVLIFSSFVLAGLTTKAG